jgi:hypothetical protein
VGIFRRSSKLPAIENYPGYEATEAAFLNASALVLEVAVKENVGPWARKSFIIFSNFLKENKKKLPDDEAAFLNEKFGIFWNAFSGYLLQPRVSGAWNDEVFLQLMDIFLEEFDAFPQKYKPNGTEYRNAAGLLMYSLDEAFKKNKQILAQPIIEYVLILWFHYSRIYGK